MDVLAVCKVLADETRYSVYRELSATARPVSVQELATELNVHPNTIRLHLDRLREVGLVDSEPMHAGTVGRPQFRYFVAAGAPSFGFEPPSHAVLAGLLATLAETSGVAQRDAEQVGYEWGANSVRRTSASSCLSALADKLDHLGFAPATDDDGSSGQVRVDFLHCPFRELAEAYPKLVCSLHQGLCAGVVDEVGGGSVSDFGALYDNEPCHVTVKLTSASGKMRV